jgi:hypothetical protein
MTLTLSRTEEWTTDYHGMTNTVVVEVFEGERVGTHVVAVSDEVAKEFGLAGDPSAEDTYNSLRQRLQSTYPYAVVEAALTRLGWSRVSPS